MFTLAHIADPHVAPLPQPSLGELTSKRLLGYLSWSVRRKHVHTRAVLDLCLAPAAVAWPVGRPAPAWLTPRIDVDTTGWHDACAALPLAHMGRGPDEDPAFFETAFAAGALAGAWLDGRWARRAPAGVPPPRKRGGAGT